MPTVRPSVKPPKSSTSAERRQVERTHPAIVLLQAAPGIEAPVGALTSLLAQSLAASFGDAVLVVHLGAPAEFDDEVRGYAGPPSLSPSTSIAGPASRSPSIELHEGQAAHLDLALPAEPRRAAAMLCDRLRQLLLLFSYVFIDASAREPAMSKALLDALTWPELYGVVRRLVVLTRGDAPPPPVPGPGYDGPGGPRSRGPGGTWSVLVTQLLDPIPEEEAPPSLRAPRGPVRERLDAARRLGRRLRERLGGDAIEPKGEPYPESRVVPELCRLRLDLRALAATSQSRGRLRDLGRLTEPERRSLARWARALTWRRVGVALGGSGAWGYAHVALMRQLEARGVPIDLVGGSSSGAMMGAFYAVLGRAGLDRAIAAGPRMQRLAWLSMLSSTVIDLGADAELGGVLLEDLEVLFLPVATNLTRGRAEVITRSTVASAVRASASAPGVFASTITRSGTYVDGAIVDNVPVVLVERMGADLLVACNPLPPPAAISTRAVDSALSDFLAELNPVNRLRDLRVSFEMMIQHFGECEPSETRVVYEPPPDESALFGTFHFGRAAALIEAVEREPRFRETVDKSAAAWARLAAARMP
jgi:predicted acylesterase/phospholipase RssA